MSQEPYVYLNQNLNIRAHMNVTNSLLSTICFTASGARSTSMLILCLSTTDMGSVFVIEIIVVPSGKNPVTSGNSPGLRVITVYDVGPVAILMYHVSFPVEEKNK